MIKNYKEADNEREMLDGNLNRMKLTKDLTELESMHDWAVKRLDRWAVKRLDRWAVKRLDRLYLFYAEELKKRIE